MKQFYSVKKCIECDNDFEPKSSQHKFCSMQCRGKHQYTTGVITTDKQYLKISNNWRLYLQKLTYSKGRENLSVDDLVRLVEKQEYKCAVSGEPLTCQLHKGMTYFTNASVDRIKPGEEYSLDNIRLVCRIVNVMKWNMSDDELKYWCERILNGR